MCHGNQTLNILNRYFLYITELLLQLWFPSIQLNMGSYPQDQEGISIGIADNSVMTNTELLPSNPEIRNIHTISIQQQAPSITRNNKDTSISNTKTLVGSFSFIEQYIQNKRLTLTAKDILLSSQRNSTKDRYISAYLKWHKFISTSCRRYSSFPYRFI